VISQSRFTKLVQFSGPKSGLTAPLHRVPQFHQLKVFLIWHFSRNCYTECH
jgi:hypothetical protein